MSLSEQQLNIWSNQGATSTSASTYNSIKTCIEGIIWDSGINYNIYLQGSYKNSTNIRGDSDVDVIVELTSTFYSNKLDLPADQLREYNEYYSNAKYSLDNFKEEVIERLKSYYGNAYIEVGNKSIKVLANSGRLDCDIVCCAEYREYKSFSKLNPNNYAKGVEFWTNRTNRRVRNFPNIHFDNGVNKNSNCYSNFKPSVRIIKNMRSKLVDLGKITSSLAPSYFIECLMYNIPNNNYYNSSHSSRIINILNTLYSYTDDDLSKKVCQNEMKYLFGSTDQQWDISSCKTFIREIIRLWNEG